jgi:hypothetical protein
MIRAALASIALSVLAGAAFAASDVAVGPFTNVNLRGGGHVVIHNGATQRVTLLKGSTQFTSFKLEGDTLRIDVCAQDCPHIYDLQIEIVSPHILGLSIRGGGHMEAKGSFPHQHSISAAIAGGGEIDARAIPADEANAAVTGGGSVRVSPASDLHAAVTGGGEIRYSGHPHVTQAVLGGGSVERE